MLALKQSRQGHPTGNFEKKTQKQQQSAQPDLLGSFIGHNSDLEW